MSSPALAAPIVSVVVLAFNEEASVRRAVGEIRDELRRLEVPWELVAVDDGSTDATGQLLDEMAKEEPRMRVVHHGDNRGLGGGYWTGFEEARGTYVTFFPADGQFPPDIIPRFLSMMDDLDMVLGYLPKRPNEHLARALSLAERALYFALLGKMPRFQGILMFRRALLDQVPLVSHGRGWGVIMELILRVSRGPYRVQSVPNEIRPRLHGTSRAVSVRNIAANLKQLAELRVNLRRSPSPASPSRR